jgi:hypothetical protein
MKAMICARLGKQAMRVAEWIVKDALLDGEILAARAAGTI